MTAHLSKFFDRHRCLFEADVGKIVDVRQHLPVRLVANRAADYKVSLWNREPSLDLHTIEAKPKGIVLMVNVFASSSPTFRRDMHGFRTFSSDRRFLAPTFDFLEGARSPNDHRTCLECLVIRDVAEAARQSENRTPS
ncbi:MAG: hypothetical protein C0483_10285 [Pirellula sp.]|nr:hypothetical protein [Pirellula sp.]